MSSLFSKAAKSLRSASASLLTADETVFIDDEGEAFYEADCASLHPDAHVDGGLACSDVQLLERQRQAIIEVMKGLGRNLLTGNFDLLRISLPVKLFEPRSYLEKLTDTWCYPHLLNEAAITTDPVERMKLVVTYILGGFHRAFLKWAKPFNPILGETFQAHLDDGSRIFVEQISHHPPVSAFQLTGPHGLYHFRGCSKPSVSYGANSIKTSATGQRVFEFADGTTISAVFPSYYIKGLLATGSPRAELGGHAEFIDAKNNLRCVVTFGKIESSGSRVLERPDSCTATIYLTSVGGRSSSSSVLDGSSNSNIPAHPPVPRTKTSLLLRSVPSLNRLNTKSITDEETVKAVARCQGNWLSHIDWDGKRYWTLLEDESVSWIPDANPLPSDCRYRADLVALQEGDYRRAQIEKERLEDLQRKEAKLRKEGI